MEIFQFSNYRDVIKVWIESQSTRGPRNQLAQAAKCSPSWITRVLNGSVQMTSDQVYGISTVMHLDEGQTDYLLLLVENERTSSLEYKRRIERKIQEAKKKWADLNSSLKEESTLSREDNIIYYSSWIPSIVHVACMIKPLTLSEIAKLTRLSEPTIAKVLSELKEMRLVNVQGVRWASTGRSVHLPAEGRMANLAHIHWRSRTIQALSEVEKAGLHYSAVHCLAKKDIEIIQAALKKAILGARKTIENSPSETLAIFCLDWFPVES